MLSALLVAAAVTLSGSPPPPATTTVPGLADGDPGPPLPTTLPPRNLASIVPWLDGPLTMVLDAEPGIVVARWELDEVDPRAVWEAPLSSGAVVSPDGELVAALHGDGLLLTTADGRRVPVPGLAEPTEGAVAESMAFHAADARRLVVGLIGSPGATALRFVDLRRLQLRTVAAPPGARVLAYGPDGVLLQLRAEGLGSGDLSEAILLVDDRGTPLRLAPGRALFASAFGVVVEPAANPARAVAVAEDFDLGDVVRIDRRSWLDAALRPVDLPLPDREALIAWSPGGRYLAAATPRSSGGYTISIVDVRRSAAGPVVVALDTAVEALFFLSPDDAPLAAVVGDGTVLVDPGIGRTARLPVVLLAGALGGG